VKSSSTEKSSATTAPAAVLYARFSPRPRGFPVESAADQIDRCRSEARRLGLDVRGEYVDEYASGGDPERAGLWDAVAALERGDTLIAESSSRLARDTVLLLTILDRVKRLGGSVSFVDGGVVEDSPTAKMVTTILAAVDTFERQQRAALTRARMRGQQRRGKLVTRADRPPYGYRVEAGRLVEHDLELPTLRHLMIAVDEAGGSYAEAARRLHESGSDNRGRKWRRQDVARLYKRGLLEIPNSA
jgi:DNA invertase Pin-like site-specific DNA recombinase